MRQFECIVVGAGLAGCAVAWRFPRGDVALIDRGDSDTASSVAAGLVTPVTGKRLAVTEGIAELLPAADAFYRRCEHDVLASVRRKPDVEVPAIGTGSPNPLTLTLSPEAGERGLVAGFWHGAPTVRFFTNADERTHFYKKADQFAEWFEALPPGIESDFGGFLMPRAMRLDTTAYLTATRTQFEAITAEVTAAGIALTPTGVAVPKLNLTAKKLVFCLGAAPHPFAAPLPFQPAKGEILTLRIPNFDTRFVRNRGGNWLVPVGGHTFLFGATYDRTLSNTKPTAAGRDELLAKLPAFGVTDFEILAHRAAVRPVLPGRKPSLGWSVTHPHVGHLTGLGSKGVLTAPAAAAALFDQPAPPDITALAHATVDALLEPDDVAVDATAGHGHDTAFLAARCRHVHAFDIQDAAERSTLARTAGRTNVTFHRVCHSKLSDLVPPPVGAVLFNLGYLPNADRGVVTRIETTVPAVRAATALLRPGGVLCILAYRGHPGGAAELDAVRAVFSTLPGWSVSETATPGPVLLVAVKP